MRKTPSYLALDLGASSGRAVLGTLSEDADGVVMRMREVHRFRTPIIESSGRLYWDIDALRDGAREALARALALEPTLRSLSVDSWAVDYVPLDSAGARVRNPFSYRDPRTKGRLAPTLVRAGGAESVYAITGIQLLEFNTLVQVALDVESEPANVARTASRLMIAEYVLHSLGGSAIAERTMASTTQLLDAESGDWSDVLLQRIGDSRSRWPRIVPPGTIIGRVARDALPTDVACDTSIVASCSHDTAAAIAAIPAVHGREWAYISCGTWSLVGAELAQGVRTREAMEAGFTNEAGLDDTVRFLKNRTGMWVLEECMREWIDVGEPSSYDEIVDSAANVAPSRDVLDLDAPEFGTRGGMMRRIEVACEQRGFTAPSERAGLVRLILDSLAASHARTVKELEHLTGRRVEVVHLVGGGARNELLCQLTADACDREVHAGPQEAASLGNLLVQARAMGDLPAGDSVRDVARRSTTIRVFSPRRVHTNRDLAAFAG
jgi:rhamnulokinase